jgi:hypothetical protein
MATYRLRMVEDLLCTKQHIEKTALVDKDKDGATQN